VSTRNLTNGGRRSIDLLLIAVPAFHVPLLVVAKSAFGIGRPERMLLIGAVIWGLGGVSLGLLRRLRASRQVSVLGVWLTTYLFMNTGMIPQTIGYPLGLLATVAVTGIILYLVSRRPMPRLHLVLGIASVLLLAEVALAGLSTASQIGESRVVAPADPLGIEFQHKPDIVFIVADAYIGVEGLDRYFEPTSDVEEHYSGLGFWAPELAFSPYASTDTALSTMLDMNYSMPEGEGINRATRRELYQRIGGHNRVVDVLHQNGYETTMIESGWSGSLCGDAVDTCVTSFIDESLYVMLSRTWMADVVFEKFGYAFTAGAQSSMTWMDENLDELTSDHNPDFVFAHLEIPHPPMFLDSECELQVTSDRSGVTLQRGDVPLEYRKALYLDQAACVNRFIARLSDSLPSDVVVILTGDHGTDSRNQLSIHPDSWTVDMMRERLNAMFALRGPEECQPPEPVFIANVFVHLLECLSGETVPSLPQRMYIYGAAEFGGAPSPIIEVDPSTIRQIIGTSAGE